MRIDFHERPYVYQLVLVLLCATTQTGIALIAVCFFFPFFINGIIKPGRCLKASAVTHFFSIAYD